MGVLARGQAMLNRVLKADAGVSVTYSRKLSHTTHTASLTARPAGGTAVGLADGGLSVMTSERDWLVEVVDLELNAEATTPHRGDRITEADGTVWELFSPQTGEPAWRYSDPQTRTVFRCHCKRVVS